MKLHEISELIDSANETEPWPFTGQDFLETLALVRLAGIEMKEPFHAELDLPVPFLLVEHVAHVPETQVIGFEDLAALEHKILSDSGFTNNFVTHTFAFVHGVARRFRIFYKNEVGMEVVFCKAKQIEDDNFSDIYTERHLKWL